MAREKSGPLISFQSLIYPVTDLARDMSKYSGVKYGPSKEEIDWFTRLYLNRPSDALNPLVSPFFAESLERLPGTIMVTAGNDPLRE
jgi:hypothetical protein